MTHPRHVKQPSMLKQKEIIARNYERLTLASQTGEKIVSTFVAGNLSELIQCFGMVHNMPETNAIQAALRRKSASYIMEAERLGHSEDVCTYVKADVGAIAGENLTPNGMPLPEPDVLLLSYTGCFTFMKWFELLRSRYKCPTLMLQIPYMGDGAITANMRDYVVRQIREDIIPALERISGRKFDIDLLREHIRKSAKAEEDFVWLLQSAKKRPSPIDAFFEFVYFMGPMFTAFRGTDDAIDYYRMLRTEIETRIAAGAGPTSPEGVPVREKYRLVVEGPPNWTHFHQFWKLFYDEGAVVVASTYTKVGGTYDFGFRHDPDRPLESLAEYCMGCYPNRNLPDRTRIIERYINDYDADGYMINSVKSCKSFSAGQLLILREIERRTGRPGAFLETDLVDPRYYSHSNVKNRIESYLQMLDQKRASARAVA
jgi:benzoyl-CoA reductase subunit B